MAASDERAAAPLLQARRSYQLLRFQISDCRSSWKGHNSPMRRLWPFLFLSFVICSSLFLEGQHNPHSVPSVPQQLLERPVTLRNGVGVVHDDAGTKSKEAQAFYDQGLAYLHSFVWIEAARSFHEALRHDPNLALAHVGLSYCYVELSKAAEAKKALATAQALAAKADDHVKRH